MKDRACVGILTIVNHRVLMNGPKDCQWAFEQDIRPPKWYLVARWNQLQLALDGQKNTLIANFLVVLFRNRLDLGTGGLSHDQAGCRHHEALSEACVCQ
jgi:hypothetical protein